jgi:hypothetical protein
MTPRIVWFVAGAASAIYVTVKARKLAYRLSTPGLVDQAEAARAGLREFGAQVRDGMAAKNEKFAAEFLAGVVPADQPSALTSSHRPELSKDHS